MHADDKRHQSILSGTATIYGGVYPTYHAAAILASEAAVDFVVRGEGEATALDLVNALAAGTALAQVAGITFRSGDHSWPRRIGHRLPIWMPFASVGS